MEEITNENVSTNQEEVINNDQLQTPEKVEMTKEELDKLLQSETDKRVTGALNTAKSKWEQEFKEKLQAEKSEAEKLAKMSEEEKYKAQLEKKEQEIADRERRVRLSEMKSETISQLAELEIPTKFTDFLLRDSADETKANLDVFSQMWKAELKSQTEKRVEESLKGSTPRRGNSNPSSMSKSEFGALPISERIEIKNNNPELYNQIMNS